MDPKTKQFLALMKASGWSQAEAARQLKITPGAVSQFCSGTTLPKAGTLNLFKLKLGHINPAALQAYEKNQFKSEALWKHEILEMLDGVPEKNRPLVLKPIKAIIKAMTETLRSKS